MARSSDMFIKRYLKSELSRISFARFMIFSAALTGVALLVLSMAQFPKSLKVTDIKILSNRFSTSNGSNYGLDTYKINKMKSEMFSAEEISSHEMPDNKLKWRSEEFPELDKDPVLSKVIMTFHSKVSQVKRKVINTFAFNYIHNVPNACIESKVKLVVAVPSRIDSFVARQAVRDTWGQYAVEPGNNAVVLFFLGVQSDRAGQDHIDNEALKYGDIVQEDFLDTYRNLSLKSISIIKWVSTYCPDSSFVLKADDDMYINVPRLVVRLHKQLALGPTFLLGVLHHNTSPFRDAKNKWYVTKSEFPDKYFPNYLSGTAYAMTTTAAMRLFVESFYVNLLFLEDVYLTGLVADRATVPRIAEDEFEFHKLESNGCYFRDRISGHKNSPEDIRKIHSELYDPNLRCHP